MSAQPATVDATRSQEPLLLLAYAHKHRYRTRNLHDGGPVPPARCKKMHGVPSSNSVGYIGPDDRYDAIVGHRGYVVLDGSRLRVFAFFRSSQGVTLAEKYLTELGATIQQIGDMEIIANAPVSRLDDLLRLIRVSKLRPGRPDFGQRALVQTENSSQKPSQTVAKVVLEGVEQN